MAKLGIDDRSAVPADPPEAPETSSEQVRNETAAPARALGRQPAVPSTDAEAPDRRRALATVSGGGMGVSREDQARNLQPIAAGVSLRSTITPPAVEVRPVEFFGFDGVPLDLPAVLMRTPRVTVVNGNTESAGDFYCEHLFFVALREAHRAGSSVVTNLFDEPLVGFLHVPTDRYCFGIGHGYSQAERHAGTRQVIGAALRDYYRAAAHRVEDGPVKILLTGYEAFGSVRNNATGEFVSERENVDAAMACAFGDRLLTAEGRVIDDGDGTPGSRTLAYPIREADGSTREVRVRTESLPVSDTALNPGDSNSVIGAMESFAPHAVISMGVAGGDEYRVEYHADDGDLGILRDGTVRHGRADDGGEAFPEADLEIQGDVVLSRPDFWQRLLDALKELFTLGFIDTETHNPGRTHRDELRARGREIGGRIVAQRADAGAVAEADVLALVRGQNPWLGAGDAREVAAILLEGIQSQGLQPRSEGQRVQPHNFSLARAIHAGRPRS